MVSTSIAPAQTLLHERYQVVRILEDGPWSIAWLAEDTQLPSRRQCIVRQVKTLTTNEQIQKQLCDRIQTEIAAWQRLGGIHGQIPWVSSFTDPQGQIFLIEEWISGITLSQKLQESGPLDEANVRDILASLLSLVDYLHQNQMVHCALEPNNILLRADDNKPVLQYGGMLNQVITNALLENNIRPIAWMPSSGYLPHEQIVLDQHYYSSNLYSLGLIGIYLLTGQDPYNLINLSTGTCEWRPLATKTDFAFAAILNKAIAKVPGERFMTAQQMLTALAAPKQFEQDSLKDHIVLMRQMGVYLNSCLLRLNPAEQTISSYSG